MKLNRIDFAVRGEYITLDALLKATGIAGSGGAAKGMVADGKISVDGQLELRKTCKLRPGQTVSLAGARIALFSEEQPAGLTDQADLLDQPEKPEQPDQLDRPDPQQ